MGRKIALVKSQEQAFKLGCDAETMDPSQKDASKFDAFIVTEPGVPTIKVTEGDLVDQVRMLYHHYSNIQGKFIP